MFALHCGFALECLTYFVFLYFICLFFFFFFLMIRRPPRSTLFPYTTSSDLRTSGRWPGTRPRRDDTAARRRDRKSTRLNSSHSSISYAVFCLKKKKKQDDKHHLADQSPHTQFPKAHTLTVHDTVIWKHIAHH